MATGKKIGVRLAILKVIKKVSFQPLADGLTAFLLKSH
jgi:hypothetical protein